MEREVIFHLICSKLNSSRPEYWANSCLSPSNEDKSSSKKKILIMYFEVNKNIDSYRSTHLGFVYCGVRYVHLIKIQLSKVSGK